MEIFLEGVALVGSLGIKSFNQAFKMIEESDGAFVPLTNGLRLKYDEASGCFVIENPEASLSAPVCPVSQCKMYSGNGSMCPCINAEISSRNEIFDSASKFGGIGINPYGSETGIFPDVKEVLLELKAKEIVKRDPLKPSGRKELYALLSKKDSSVSIIVNEEKMTLTLDSENLMINTARIRFAICANGACRNVGVIKKTNKLVCPPCEVSVGGWSKTPPHTIGRAHVVTQLLKETAAFQRVHIDKSPGAIWLMILRKLFQMGERGISCGGSEPSVTLHISNQLQLYYKMIYTKVNSRNTTTVEIIQTLCTDYYCGFPGKILKLLHTIPKTPQGYLLTKCSSRCSGKRTIWDDDEYQNLSTICKNLNYGYISEAFPELL